MHPISVNFALNQNITYHKNQHKYAAIKRFHYCIN